MNKLLLIVTALCSCLVLVTGQDNLKVVSVQIAPGQPPKQVDSTRFIDSHIIGGVNATAGQIPYQARVIIVNSWLCGGSLIGPGWVVTAAHCAVLGNSFQLYFGILIKNATGTTATSTTKYVHPQYNSNTLNNDIALLKLTTNVALTSTVNVIKLPPLNTNPTYVGLAAMVSGWGRVNGSSNSAWFLQYAYVSVISNTACIAVYGSTTIIGTTICAQNYTSSTTCNGDSGGPLALLSGTNTTAASRTLIGVVSFGPANPDVNGACDKSKPSGYARVTGFTTWIKNITSISY